MFRRIEAGYAPGMLSTASPPGTWDFVASVPADGLGTDGHYSVIVPTLADSTQSAGMHWTTYFVRGRTATPGTVYESAPDSGYSVDNLAPSVPAGLLASSAGGGFDLSWDPNPEPDVRYYNVYRGASEGFVADDLSRIGATAGNSFSDPAPGGETYYQVAAVKLSGNEGPPATTHGAVGVGRPQITSRFHSIRRAPTRSGRIRGSTTRFPRAGATSPWPYTTSRGAGCAPFRTAGARKGSPNSTGTAGTTAAARCPPGSTS